MSDLKNSMLAREELKWGLIFISPWIIGFLVFYLAPMVASFGFSLYDFNLATPEQAKYVGFANWKRFFFDDPQAVPAMGVDTRLRQAQQVRTERVEHRGGEAATHLGKRLARRPVHAHWRAADLREQRIQLRLHARTCR